MSLSGQLQSIGVAYSNNNLNIYRVAPYQRNYTWLLSNCATLVNDLIEVITKGKMTEDHFFCEMVFTLMGVDSSTRKEILEVADGQQRITSILLLSLAIRDLARNLAKIHPEKAKHYNAIVEEAEKNIFLKIDGEKHIKFQLNEINSEVLSVLVKDKDGEEDKSFLTMLDEDLVNMNNKEDKCRLIPNYNYFYTAMKQYDADGHDLEDILIAISKLVSPITRCSNRREAIKIYISKNMKGRKLISYEGLKALLVGFYPNIKDSDRANRRWAAIERKVGFDKMQDFVTDVIIIINEFYETRQTQIKPNSVYDKFCEIVKKMEGSIEDKANIVFAYLEEYAAIYQKYIKNIKDSHAMSDDILNRRLFEFEIAYDLTKNNAMLLYLLKIYAAGEIDKEVLAETLNAFAVRQVRAKVAGEYKVTDREMGAKRLKLVRGEVDKGKANELDKTAWKLVQGGQKTMGFPSDKTIIARYTDNELGNDIRRLTYGRNNIMSKYLMYRMNELCNGTDKMPRFSKALTLEHIVPTEDKQLWETEMRFSDETEIAKYAHKLGNFVLVTRTSDERSMVERQRTYRKSSYPIAREIGNNTPWQKEDIEALTKKYVHLMVKVFPVPEKYVIKK